MNETPTADAAERWLRDQHSTEAPKNEELDWVGISRNPKLTDKERNFIRLWIVHPMPTPQETAQLIAELMEISGDEVRKLFRSVLDKSKK